MESLIEQIGDDFAGLWVIRYVGKPKRWCVTFNLKGKYFETNMCKTPKGALMSALKILNSRGHQQEK